MIPPSSDPPLRLDGTATELGAHLPQVVYHAIERWRRERVHALAIYCSDGRWGEAFDEFCHRHLQIPHYDRWAVPGGPAWVALTQQEPDLYPAVRLQLDFLVQKHELERVVLITHHGCAWYSHGLTQTPAQCLAAQAEDAEAAAAALREWYPGLRVEAYLAMRQNEWVTFHRLDRGAADEARGSRRRHG
jgi:hypothetical protein